MMLSLNNLHVACKNRTILAGVTLRVQQRELQVLMGPNGSGKTTLAQVIAGNPNFIITKGSMRFGRTNLLAKKPDERRRLGLFVAFQQPLAIPGVASADFLRLALKEGSGIHLRPSQLRERLVPVLAAVGLPHTTLYRELNVGFSGGEQKRFELAQLLALGAKIAVLDEIDSGLDVDGIRLVARSIEAQRHSGTGVLLITHNPAIVSYCAPTAVHILSNGRIVASGSRTLAATIAEKGYRAV